MKYKIKANKKQYYEISDWLRNHNYELEDCIRDAVNSARRIDTGLPCLEEKLPLTKRKNGFKCIDWNKWDEELGRPKDKYIEFTDLKLELIFLCSFANCIDRENDQTILI